MSTKMVTLVLTGLFIVSGALAAQPRNAQRGMLQGMKMLDLSEEQKNQIADLRLNLQKDIIPLHSEADKLRSELKIELTADRFDEGKVRKIIANLSDLEENIHMKRILNQRAIRDLLTPEQQKKYDLLILSKPARGKREMPGFEHRKPRIPATPQWDE